MFLVNPLEDISIEMIQALYRVGNTFILVPSQGRYKKDYYSIAPLLRQMNVTPLLRVVYVEGIAIHQYLLCPVAPSYRVKDRKDVYTLFDQANNKLLTWQKEQNGIYIVCLDGNGEEWQLPRSFPGIEVDRERFDYMILANFQGELLFTSKIKNDVVLHSFPSGYSFVLN